MTKVDELNLFLERADELIDSKYILADVKLASFLKSIASSQTLLALFQNCLSDFDYHVAQKKYFVKSQHLSFLVVFLFYVANTLVPALPKRAV